MKLYILIIFLLTNSLAQTFEEFQASEKSSMESFEQDFGDFLSQEEIDFQDFMDRESAEFHEYASKIARIWGDKTVSTSKQWVVYDKSRKSRIKMDFENNNASIEISNALSKKKALKKAKKLLKVISSQKSADGKSIVKTNISNYPKSALKNAAIVEEKIKVKNKVKTVYKIKLPFKHSAFNDRVKPVIPIVLKYSKKYNLRPEMIMGIIHTESAFNPRAKSWANAYGLMQLVPKYGGLESYQYVYGKSIKPSPKYLYNTKNNIELGCAYLAILQSKYYSNVTNSLNKDYIAICSYNTGPNNVAKAFNASKI